MEQKLSNLEAFKAMQCFLLKYFERTKSEDIGSLLGDVQLLQDNMTLDPAAWNDWLKCIEEITHS
jgi:hypothetical protein